MPSGASSPHQRFGRKGCILLLGVLILTFVSFLPTLQNQFTNWDDREFIFENPSVITLDWPHIKDAFTNVYVNVYCPLTVLSWAVENRLFGFNPFVFHLDNLLLHLWVTTCVFVLALRMGLPLYAGAMAALLWGVHPMHVESVSWLSERKDCLFASFYVPALISYWSYLKTGRKKYYVFSMLFGLLSILSKATALSLPVALFVMDWMAQRKFDKKAFLDKIPHFAYIVPLTMMTFVHHTDIPDPLPGEDINKAIPIFFWTFSFYIQTFFWPFNIFPYYQLPLPITWTNWAYIVGLLIFIAYGILLYIFRKNRWFTFAFLFFMATIFFLLRYGVLVRYTSVVADRHIYVPSIGFCLFFGWLFYTGFQKLRPWPGIFKVWAALLLVVIYVSFAVKTFFLTQIWKDSITFWTYSIEKNPQFVAKAHTLRAFAYLELEEYDKAWQDANQTLTYNPTSHGAFNVRGIVYSHRGQEDLALKEFDLAVKYRTTKDFSFTNRANVYVALGRYDEAIADAGRSIEIEPTAKAYGIRGKAHGLKGQLEQAIADLDRSIYLNPKDPLTYFDRGFFQNQLGHHEQAIADFNKALAFDPNDAFTLDQRGAVYFAAGQYDLAQRDFDRVIALDPTFARGFNNRGSTFLARDQYDLALADFNNALALDPHYATVYANRSIVFQEKRQWAKALADMVKAQSLGYEINAEDLDRLRQKAAP